MIGMFLNSTLSISWIKDALNNILIFFDAIIYALAEESYKIFRAASESFKITDTDGIMAAIIGRILTLVAVFMFFRLLIIFIQYIMEPDKIKDQAVGTNAIIKNIVTVVVMLTLIYSGFLFGIIHDVQTLLLGGPNSSFEKIGEWFKNDTKNEHVFRNIIFGVNDQEFDNFGREISANMLGSFLYLEDQNGKLWTEYDETSENAKWFHMIANAAPDSNLGFFVLPAVVDWSDVNLKYIPFISGIAGLFMIYTFFSYSIEILVRAFKLFIMEMLAPLAVVSYIDPKKGKEVFKNFFKTYFQIYMELFIRVAMVFLSVVIINKGLSTILSGDLFGEVGFLTKSIMYVLAVMAVFRFMKVAPKLISDVFGFKFEQKQGGFGKMLGAVAGTAIGTGIGVGSALHAGAGGWAAAFQGISGGIQGGLSGSSAKNLSGFATGMTKTAGGISSRSYKIESMGGMRNYVGGVGGTFLGGNRKDDQTISKIDKQIKAEDDKLSKLDKTAGIYSQGDQLRQNLNNSIDSEFNNKYGSLNDRINNDPKIQALLEQNKEYDSDEMIQRRQQLINEYTEAREKFADRVLSGAESSESVSYAKQQYNEHIERNANLEGYSNADASGAKIEVTDYSSLKESEKFSRDATDKLASEKYSIETTKKGFEKTKKDIQDSQKYKNNKNYSGK